jgi:hypothetical protein
MYYYKPLVNTTNKDTSFLFQKQNIFQYLNPSIPTILHQNTVHIIVNPIFP